MQMHDRQKIVTVYVRLPPKRICFQVPENWSINKIKCLIVSQIPTLQFNTFQITYEDIFLKGTYPIKLYVPIGENQIVVGIRKSLKCEPLQKIYTKTISSFFKKLQQQQNKLGNNGNDITNYTLPFLNSKYQEAFLMGEGHRFTQYKNQIFQENGEQQQGFGLFHIFQIIGLYFTINILVSVGNIQQIIIIGLVCLSYYIIQRHVRNQQGKRRQRKNVQPQPIIKEKKEDIKEQQKQNIKQMKEEDKQLNNVEIIKNKKKARLFLILCALSQFIYCYFLSLFPNWTFETHLQANRELITKMVTKIQELDNNQIGKIKID